MMDFYNSTFNKARKVHECECCGRLIEKGQHYFRQRGKFYGEFFDRCICIICEGVMNDFCSEVENEFSYDQLHDHAQYACCDYCGLHEDDCPYECRMNCPKVIQKFVGKDVFKYLPDELKVPFPHDLRKECEINICNSLPVASCTKYNWECEQCPTKRIARAMHRDMNELLLEVIDRINRCAITEDGVDKTALEDILKHYKEVAKGKCTVDR